MEFNELVKYGIELQNNGRYNEAICEYNKILKIYTKLNNIDKACIKNYLGIIYNEIGDFKKAIKYYNSAINLALKYEHQHSLELANFYNNLGSLFEEIGNFEESQDGYKKSLKILTKYFKDNNADLANLYNNIGVLFFKKKEFLKSKKYYLLAIENLNPEKDWKLISTIFNNLGIIYDEKSDYDMALLYFEKSLEIRLSNYNKYHFEISNSYNNIGSVYRKIKSIDKAKYFYNLALTIRRRNIEYNINGIARIYNNLAILYNQEGNWIKSITMLNKAIILIKRKHGNSNIEIFEIRDNLSDILIDKRFFSEALINLKILIKVAENSNKYDDDIINIKFKIAICYKNLKKYRLSISYLKFCYLKKPEKRFLDEMINLNNLYSGY